MQYSISLAKFTKVAFVGGGTGGHVTPITALMRQHADHRIDYIWLGSRGSLEERECAKTKARFFHMSTLRVSSIFSPWILLYPFILVMGVFQARRILVAEKPDIIFSKG
jgi:UDP-N-acetylglucosamine--N-acetylmuramyl-(pentapeptide) pyrophosphoryl-undecaprenol N-acetylglucosamine transferase